MQNKAVKEFRIHVIMRLVFYHYVEFLQDVNFEVEDPLVLMS